jgi:hypothetical protein
MEVRPREQFRPIESRWHARKLRQAPKTRQVIGTRLMANPSRSKPRLLACGVLFPHRGEMPMLRFSYYRSDDGEEWSLCDQLSGPWVDELRSVWRRIRQDARGAHAVVDLREVTFIDEAGEQLLVEMQGAGADFVVAGVEHKHLLANLGASGSRTVRRSMERLGGGRS